jgi:hypothetical protein
MADVANEIAALMAAPIRLLRTEWRRHHRAEPPARLSRDLLLRGITYKLQEQADEGPARAVRRQFRELARRVKTEGSKALGLAATIKPGARLVREWHGQSHVVTVLEDGFEHEGQRYRSLTQIAKRITGTHWSGPRFFGIKSSRGSSRAPASRTGRHDHDQG